MDFRLLFTQKALSDLAEIIGYIAEDDADAAESFGNSLLDHIELLKNFPHAGSRVRERSRVRKLTHSPIVVYYQLHEAKHLIEVLHLRHGWRRPPKF